MTETAHTPLPELLPCPNEWCGDHIYCTYHRPPLWRVRCGCGVSGPTAYTEAEAITAWNTRADSHHRLVEALEPFAFVGEDDPKDTQAVWEMIYRDRVQDWFSYEDFERARDLLAALKEAGR